MCTYCNPSDYWQVGFFEVNSGQTPYIQFSCGSTTFNADYVSQTLITPPPSGNLDRFGNLSSSPGVIFEHVFTESDFSNFTNIKATSIGLVDQIIHKSVDSYSPYTKAERNLGNLPKLNDYFTNVTYKTTNDTYWSTHYVQAMVNQSLEYVNSPANDAGQTYNVGETVYVDVKYKLPVTTGAGFSANLGLNINGVETMATYDSKPAADVLRFR
jgi:hypothetical protein